MAPIAVATCAMIAIVGLVGHLMTGVGALVVLLVKIAVGVGSYALLGELFRLEAWKEMKEIVVGYLPKKK